jgi:hypothetical protein
MNSKDECPGIYLYIQKIVVLISYEWLLTRHRSNGGVIIILRAFCISSTLLLIAIFLRNLIDPNLCLPITFYNFRIQLIELAPWFAALFAGTYLALYARFSAQWSYLANLYNQIKQAEMGMETTSSASEKISHQKKILCEWKAGYIEDAIELHISRKPNVAGVINAWSQDDGVEDAFKKNTTNGKKQWDDLIEDIRPILGVK